jgi:hypothetical protein
VAANTSEDVDAETGDSETNNDADVFVGLLAVGAVGDVTQVPANTVVVLEGTGNEIRQSNTNLVFVSGASNTQEGNNSADLFQDADATSGDAVGGQVIGVVSAGDTAVDATNNSSESDVSTGDAESTNDAVAFVGLLSLGEVGDVTVTQNNTAVVTGDNNTVDQTNTALVDIVGAANDQIGDNEFDHAQEAVATSGDGVAGQVIGVVTSSGGSADVVGANRSENSDISSGNADSSNDSDVFVGLLSAGEVGDITVSQVNDTEIVDGDNNTVEQINEASILGAGAANTQDGDNTFDGAQNANSASGDGVGGQVIGIVSTGDTSVDATSRSTDVDVSTGDSEASNEVDAFSGLLAEGSIGDTTVDQTNTATITGVDDADVSQSNFAEFTGDAAANFHLGDDDHEVDQSASSFSGDGVAGQVLGVVTAAGGTADVVIANESVDVDAESGDGDHANDDEAFVGLQVEGAIGDRSQTQDNTAVIGGV